VLAGGSKEAQLAAFRAATTAHGGMAKAALAGMGVDRHILALKGSAARLGESHAFLAEPILAGSSNWRISSSNVTNPLLKLFGFGPTAADGYGCGYMVFGENMPFNFTSFNSCAETDAATFAAAVEQSLLDIRDLNQ
jgi:carnitine O-acetyltransferase